MGGKGIEAKRRERKGREEREREGKGRGRDTCYSDIKNLFIS